MQKVEGSNPFSRFQKGPYLQAFFASAVGLCVCVGSDSLRTRRGPIVRRSKENALFAGRFWFVRTEVLLRACRRSGVLPAAAVSPTLAAAARSCGRRDTSGPGPLGPVRFQSGNRQVNLGPLRDLASHGPQSRELSRTTASEAAARCPSRGACAAAVTRGHLRGRRFPSASRRPRASGLGSSSSSRAGTRSSTMAASARAGEAGAAPRGIHARGASE
jgi:hypothetical protein